MRTLNLILTGLFLAGLGANAIAMDDSELAMHERKAAVTIAEAKLSTAQVEVERGQFELDFWRDELRKKTELYSTNAVSGEDYLSTKFKATQADFALRELQNGVIQAQADLDAAKARMQRVLSVIKK